jgi:uncharacterized membrane protein
METKKGKISLLLAIIVTFGFLGLVDSAILLDIHNNHTTGKVSQFCLPGAGCDFFDQTGFSTIYGLPIGTIGLVFYLLFIVIVMLKKYLSSYYKTKLIALSIIGVLMSAVMVYVLLFVVKRYCSYCWYAIVINLFIAFFVFLYCKREIKSVTKEVE